MSKKNIKINKKFEKKVVESENEIKSFIKTAIIIAICFGAIYGLIVILSNVGVFEKGYTEPSTTEVEISDTNILIGSVFNRPESSYYVAFGNFSNDYEDVYLEYLITNTDKRVYKVDMSLKINESYLSENSNKKAKKASELKIKTPTLIKIKNGEIAKYFDTIELIKDELN